MVTSVDYSQFLEKKQSVVRNVMVHVEIAADEIVEKTESITFPLVPLLFGYLQDSFYERYISPAPNLEVEMLYAAYNIRDGYNYAFIQDDTKTQYKLYGHLFHHPRKGQSPYLTEGFNKVPINSIFQKQLLIALS